MSQVNLKKPQYSAIILTRDSGTDLVKCVKSLMAQTITPDNVLIYARRSPLVSDHTIKSNLEKNGIDYKKTNLIVELNAPTESGWDSGTTPHYEAFHSMSRMRNTALKLMSGENILWLDADVQIKSTNGVEKLIEASLEKRDDKNLLFAAPVKKSAWKFEHCIKEVNSVSGADVYRMHIDKTGPVKFRAYTDKGLCHSIREMGKYLSCDASGSLVYMPLEWIKEHPDPFQCNIFSEWSGVCDKTGSKTIAVSSVNTIHRSMNSFL